MGQNPLSNDGNQVQKKIDTITDTQTFTHFENPFKPKESDTLNIQTLEQKEKKPRKFQLKNPFKKDTDAKVVVVEQAENNHFDIRNHIHPEKLTNIFSGKSLKLP